jgi:hypothetical protein
MSARVDMQFEVTKDELRLMKEAARELGCWSLEEFVRMARAEFLQGYIRIEALLKDGETS